MTGNSHVSSERGIALIVVLLLMMVLSGLATGFAVTGQIESQMGHNEMYFAGARAAAEAGLNRAIVEITADHGTNWIKGADNTADVDNLAAASNADNGSLDFKLGAGPHFVDSKNEYYYDVQILDDDNPELYETPLTTAQLARMNEANGQIYNNTNDRLILRSIGYGPHGTVVKLARILESFDHEHITTTNTPTVSNPATSVVRSKVGVGSLTGLLAPL